MKSVVRAAAVQFAAQPLDKAANIARASRLVREAAAQGAQLVVLPEATFTGEGLCFLETGRGKASAIQGRFLADPPQVELTQASEAGFAAKRAFESERLAAWFGS